MALCPSLKKRDLQAVMVTLVARTYSSQIHMDISAAMASDGVGAYGATARSGGGVSEQSSAPSRAARGYPMAARYPVA